MSDSTSLRCAILGTTSLPGQCAQILRDEGHTVSLVATDDAETRRAAADAGVSTIIPPDQLAESLASSPVDYLFSVNNLSLVDEDILRMPGRGAINFHDGPLPSYAGLNAPSWGILHGATGWNITWHLMTGGVDEGAILLEEPVDIQPDDTSVSLNMKCFEAAIRSFPQLVRGLAEDTLEPREQDLSRRLYFGRWQRPDGASVLRWSRPADELSALVRALDFGVYVNRLGVAKIWTGKEAVAVLALDVLETGAGAEPGTVLDVTGVSITVATGTADVLLTGLRRLEGGPVTDDELIALGLKPGQLLPEPSEQELEALTELDRSLGQNEDYWTSKLATLPALRVPGSTRAAGGNSINGDAQLRSISHSIPADCVSALEALPSGGTLDEKLGAAIVLFLARMAGDHGFAVAYAEASSAALPAMQAALRAPTVPLHCEFDLDGSFESAHAAAVGQLVEDQALGGYLRDLLARRPELHSGVEPLSVAIVLGEPEAPSPSTNAELTLVVTDGGSHIKWLHDRRSLSDEAIATMRRRFDAFLYKGLADPDRALADLSVLTPDEEEHVLVDWNQTAAEYPMDVCLHQLIEQQAARTPDRPAVVCQGHQVTYAELCRRADALAGHLHALGAKPGARVGVCMERSVELVVSLLAILKAGAAYVPLDPTYPADRIRLMIEDSEPVAVVCERATASELLAGVGGLVVVDEEPKLFSDEPGPSVGSPTQPDDPAYVIYTSGSTGVPKGVIVSHRNVVNFIHGMDPCIDQSEPGVFLAVTSISFDISVLELFWTLARGFQVVLYRGTDQNPSSAHAGSSRPLDFSLFFFASKEHEVAQERYRLLTEAVKFADARGFSAVWTPERHFHAFGGLFPNPSLTSAAIAAMTKNVKIRAGSVVSPLHNPIRIAEEWSFVDNISGGRVGISFASGWQPADFVLAPDNFADRKQLMFRQIEVVQRLWRGESVAQPGPLGKDVDVRILPKPVQPELPVWITAAGSPDTFRMAGEHGFGVLTHLLGQSVAELGQKIAVYREARGSANGAPGHGNVVLMLHTFVGPDNDRVRELVRAPMKAYLRSSVDLIQKAAWTFPTFKQATTTDDGGFSLDGLSDQEMDEVLDFSFERYFETSGLLGTPEKCLELIGQLRDAGVDEIACLIDFHNDTDAVLSHLPDLDGVRARATTRAAAPEDETIPALIARYGVTHMQCTPSMARMLLDMPGADRALGSLEQLLVGGEALPPTLARELAEVVPGDVVNMYGPTETTIWSSTFRVGANNGKVAIGRPIANTQFYILDEARHPVAPGTPGELYIGGDGVTLGYLKRPEMTEERFVADTFSERPGARMYRTGDLVRYLDDGNVEFLGRADHQVKIRGYRIELGEVEAALARHPDVGETVVVADGDRQDSGTRLIAYLTARNAKQPSTESLRTHLKQTLPEFMIPSTFEVLAALPRTPNGKLDRAALPAPGSSQAVRSAESIAPRDELERTLVKVWEDALGVRPIGIQENFFELGGHSLLAMRVFSQLKRSVGIELPLASFLRAPTIEQLAEVIRRSEQTEPHREWRSLVEIEGRGSKPPLFCVHAHGGHVMFYRDLARRLGSDRPFYALQAQGVDGVLEPLTSFEQMATNYVEEIRGVQPHGPYRLGGDCLGGVLALEMARQLRAQGEDVALVAMFDSFHPRYRPYLPRPLYELLHRLRLLFGFNLSNVRRLPRAEKIAYIRVKLGRGLYMLRYRLSDGQRKLGRGRMTSKDPLIRTQAALDVAFEGHDPRPYDGRVALFRSVQQPFGIRKDPTLGWSGVLNELEVHVIPSYFTTGVYEPVVGRLAYELSRCLDEADLRGASASARSAA